MTQSRKDTDPRSHSQDAAAQLGPRLQSWLPTPSLGPSLQGGPVGPLLILRCLVSGRAIFPLSLRSDGDIDDDFTRTRSPCFHLRSSGTIFAALSCRAVGSRVCECVSVCERVCTGFVPGILVGEIRGNNRTARRGRQIDNSDRAAPPPSLSALYRSSLFFLSGSGGGRNTPPSPPPHPGPEPRGLPLRLPPSVSNTPSVQARSSWLERAGVPRVGVTTEMGDGAAAAGEHLRPRENPDPSHQPCKRALRRADSRFRTRAGRPREVTPQGCAGPGI